MPTPFHSLWGFVPYYKDVFTPYVHTFAWTRIRFLEQEERLLNDDGWIEEANGVIREVEAYVKQLTVSEKVPSSSLAIHLNLVTLEDGNYTVRLCERGFSIVAHQLDSVHWDG